MSETTDIAVPGVPSLWTQRIRTYAGTEPNTLWEIAQAILELRKLGVAEGITTFDLHSGLPNIDEPTLRRLVERSKETYPALAKQLESDRPTPIIGYKTKIYDTGSDAVCAFDNIKPYAPVSILVCPTKKNYFNYEHFTSEASEEEVGAFMKAANKVAQDAVKAFDDAISKKPEVAAKRDYYEHAFAHLDEMEAKGINAAELGRQYARDSEAYGFAVRDPYTGHSGYRIAFNGTPSTGMSEPHLHAHILAGRFLGGVTVPNPAAVYEDRTFKKLTSSLARELRDAPSAAANAR